MINPVNITVKMYEALKIKYEAQIKEAETTMLIYFNSSVGIGEHPQHLEEMDKLLAKMVDANDKLKLLEEKFNNIWL